MGRRRRRRRVGEAGPRPRPLVRPPSSLTSASGSARLPLSLLSPPLAVLHEQWGYIYQAPMLLRN